MIDFKEEISKYEPIMGMDEVEKAIRSDEIKDIMDLLQHLTKRMPADSEKE